MTQLREGSAAALLRSARTQAGLSQRALAENAGVPATMISAYERGLREPSLVTLQRLVAAAGYELRLELAPVAAASPIPQPRRPAPATLEPLPAPRRDKKQKRRDKQAKKAR